MTEILRDAVTTGPTLAVDGNRRESIPARLDRMPPGPELAALLASIDVRRLSGHDRVIVLRAQRRMVSFFEAKALESMSAIVDAYDDELGHHGPSAAEGASAEIRVALTLTRRAADMDLALALALRRRLPAVWELLAAGHIDLRRARTMVSATDHLPTGVARQVIACIVDDAARLTTGQLAVRIRRLALEADPDSARDRYRRAVDDRRVVTETTPEGTVHLLGLDLPADRVTEIASRIDAIARSLKTSSETRAMDQLRADVYLDLLTGSDVGSSRRGSIELRVELTTLIGLTDAPGDLGGYGPVVADLARQITSDHLRDEWRYTITHNGQPVVVGTTRRRPTTAQRRVTQARDVTCTFPGCRVPAIDCDLDHGTPWAEAHRTDTDDLTPKCRHDHVIRHRYGWVHRRLPDGGHRWTSPLGHTTVTSALDPCRPP